MISIIQILLWSVSFLETNEYIVKTHDREALWNYTAQQGFKMSPFLSYPEPSSEALERFGCYWIVSLTSEGTPTALVELRTLPGVELVEPNAINVIEFPEREGEAELESMDTFFHPYVPDDSLFTEQWEKPVTQADWAWNLTTGDKDVVIAILDTGASTDHEDLKDNLLADKGFNFVDSTTNIEDDHGHGTHTSGIAAAKIDNGKGIAGVAGNCSILPIKVVDAQGTYTNQDLAEGIIYAADQKAPVINMSLQGTHSAVLEDAVNYAWETGAFMCACAGNFDEEASMYPAAYQNVMSVGATSYGDIRWFKSNYGETVDIYAPGFNILSTIYSDKYEFKDGTSMASPQVAGVAALIWSQHPEYSNEEIWNKIIQSADTIQTDKGSALRVNARKALDVVGVNETRIKEFEIFARQTPEGRILFTYHADSPGNYSLDIFDVSGRKISEVQGLLATHGNIEVSTSIPSGVYFWRFGTNRGFSTGSLVYMKP